MVRVHAMLFASEQLLWEHGLLILSWLYSKQSFGHDHAGMALSFCEAHGVE